MSTKSKLEQAKAKLEANGSDIASLEQNTVAINDEIAELQATLAEEQKPKFEWGLGKKCYRSIPEDARICLYGGDGKKRWYDLSGNSCNIEPVCCEYVDTGKTIFDDLRATARKKA